MQRYGQSLVFQHQPGMLANTGASACLDRAFGGRRRGVHPQAPGRIAPFQPVLPGQGQAQLAQVLFQIGYRAAADQRHGAAASRYRRAISSSSAVSTWTASGVSARSISVPSTSRKNAQSVLAVRRRIGVRRSRLVASRFVGQTAAAAHRGGIQEHASGPAEDVELGHQSAHQAHAVALFVRRHGQRHVQRGRASGRHRRD